jgi:hypothetical protein
MKEMHIQWIPINCDMSGLEYFVPIKRLPQLYEAARKELLLLYNACNSRFWHSSYLRQLAMTGVGLLFFNLFK